MRKGQWEDNQYCLHCSYYFCCFEQFNSYLCIDLHTEIVNKRFLILFNYPMLMLYAWVVHLQSYTKLNDIKLSGQPLKLLSWQETKYTANIAHNWLYSLRIGCWSMVYIFMNKNRISFFLFLLLVGLQNQNELNMFT